VNRRDVTVLDCTFRDGGYYTNWEFEPSLAAAYLATCAEVGNWGTPGSASTTAAHSGTSPPA
jgi:hypothetical protein